MMSHHKIEVKDLYYSYPDGHQAVKGMSFIIGHGESVGIVGANGAGKSTLIMLLMGLVFPSGGTVIIGDAEVTKKTLPHIRQRMGLVFQDPDDQLFMPTVYEDVAFGPRNFGLSETEIAVRVDEALEMTGITHLKDRPPYKLSGGEKRAAAIASVLAMQPDILIMDEPTSNLDPKSRRRTINLLEGFKHTKIIASHDLDMINSICARTIVFSEGRIAADGETSRILTDETLLEACNLR